MKNGAVVLAAWGFAACAAAAELPMTRAESDALQAQLEVEQAGTRQRMEALQRERREAWDRLLNGPFARQGGREDETARRLAAEEKRLDAEGRAKSALAKQEKDPEEAEALKIEMGSARRRGAEARKAYADRVLDIASTSPEGRQLAEKVRALDADIARLDAEWGARRGRIGQLNRDAQQLSPAPADAEVINLELPPPPDAAERRKAFAGRNSPAEIERLAHDFFRLVDPAATGAAPACALYRQGRFAEALTAYRDYFFDKVVHPEKFGIAEESFTDDSRQFMSIRQPPPAWARDCTSGIAHATSHEFDDRVVLRVKVGAPGAVHWGYVPDPPILRKGKSVWLEFQRRFVRAVGNDGGYEGLRDCLLDTYLADGDEGRLALWAEYMDDWYLNAQRAVNASPHNLRWADPIIPRLVCGFVSRMRFAARLRPDLARKLPAPTLARILIRLQEEYLAPNILVARTTRQNWNMMGLGFNVRNALLLPEFLPAQWAGREAKRGIENAYLFTIMPDGGSIEYGDEGHQGVWRERVGGLLDLFERQRPAWATPAWRAELLDTFNQNARFWIRHLKPDGYQHRDGLRNARGVYVGNERSVFGPQSLNSQAPWVCAEPEARRMLETVFGPFEIPGCDVKAPAGGPEHLSDVSPFVGEVILRGAWLPDAPFFYMHGGRMPNSGSYDDATAFRVHDHGLNLLIASPLSVDGRLQNAHYGMVDEVGSKTIYLAFNDGALSIGRWRSAADYDFAECFYDGAYENKTGRPYRTTFQPGGNDRRVKNTGAPAVTNVQVARQVWFLRDPACWIVVDRIRSGSRHTYRQDYDIYTPVTKLEWLHRTKSPIANASDRVILDAAGRFIRSENPGWPNVEVHHFAAAPIRYAFDKDSHGLDAKTRGEISVAEDEWRLNRPELREALAFSRRVNVDMDADGNAVLATLIASQAATSTARAVIRRLPPAGPASDPGFEATFADGSVVRFSEGRVDVRASCGRTWQAEAGDTPIQPVTFGPAASAFTDHVDVTMNSATPDAEIRYTLDGSDPTPQSPRYAGPVRLDRTARVKAIAMRPGLKAVPWQLEPGLVTIPTWALFEKQAPRPAAIVQGLQPGLAFEYIEGPQFKLVAFSPWQPPKTRGTTGRLMDVSMRETDGAFAVRYKGFIELPADGVYTFHAPREFVMPDIEAGYDLRVFLDGSEWEPALRRHALGDWSVALQRGAHSFEVIFVDTRSVPLKYETWRDWPNPAVLWKGVAPVLEISGPGIRRQRLPDAWLKRPGA